jgi:heme exporter protein D
VDDTEIPLTLNDLRRRTAEQVEQIREVLQQIKPIQCDMLGEKTVTAVAEGEYFEAVEVGRHINLLETITLLSGLATLVQLAMIIVQTVRNKVPDNQNIQAQEVREAVLQKISNHPELGNLKELVAKDPVLLDQVVSLLPKDEQQKKS